MSYLLNDLEKWAAIADPDNIWRDSNKPPTLLNALKRKKPHGTTGTMPDQLKGTGPINSTIKAFTKSAATEKEELTGREKYEKEMALSRKLKHTGRALKGVGLVGGVANIGGLSRNVMKEVGLDSLKDFDPEQPITAVEDPEAAERLMKSGKRFGRNAKLTAGLFATGVGTSMYNKRRKKRAERDYLNYLESEDH